MRARAFNPQIFLEFLCYSIFGELLLYLVSSGKYLSYVTPRMKAYLYFTVIVMGVWALAALGRLFRPQHKVRSVHCFVLAIPILLLLLPHSPLSTSDLSGNYIGGNTFAGGPSGGSGFNAPAGTPTENPAKGSAEPANDPAAVAESDPPPEETAPADSIDPTNPDAQTDTPESGYAAGLSGLDAANKRITVSNDDFGIWLSEIYADMKKYEGYTIVMTGYVFKDSELIGEGEFVPARPIMTCCVADLAPGGLLCKYDKVSELKEKSWVTVEGTLFIGKLEYDGTAYDDPQVTVTKITPAEEVKGYVYPY